MKKLFFPLFVLTLVLLAIPVKGDLMVPGTKHVPYCIEVSNINEFQDYAIVAYGLRGNEVINHMVLTQDNCMGLYIFTAGETVAAIRKDIFNKTEIQKYSTTDPGILQSGISIDVYENKYEPSDSPLADVRDVLEIKELNENTFRLEKVKVVYTYMSGMVEEIPYSDQNKRPEPTGKLYWYVIWYILLPSLAAIGIISILRKRKGGK